MRSLRPPLFWIHLTAGVCAGIVILIMSFTGAVLALKPQIQNWVDRDIRIVRPEAARLTPFALLDGVKAQRPDAAPQSLAFDRDPTIAATVGLGAEGNVYVNPYTGEILGRPSPPLVRFFQTMTGSLGGVFLVYTGLSLAFRRLVNWSLWARLGARSAGTIEPDLEPPSGGARVSRSSAISERPSQWAGARGDGTV
jgi:hypothetical protein